MLVEHALGVPVVPLVYTQAARVPLVAFMPAIIAILGVEQVVELAVEADVMLDRRPTRLHPLNQRRECRIVEQHPVLGVMAIYSSWSSNSRGLMVWSTPPIRPRRTR